MVSKLSILKTYYHLPLEDQFSFTYEDEHYYLTNKPFPLYYQKYISLLQINPFKIINNIYQQKNSQGYILYQVQSIPLDIQKIISLSLIPQETKTIKEIKKEWIQYYESILIYTPLNSLEYQIIYYSLFTLCQLSIELLNHYFLSTTAINLSYQHKNIHSYEDVYLIENINLNLYIHDIFYLYLNNTITINKTLALNTDKKVVVQTPKSKSSIRIISIDEQTVSILKRWKFKQKEKFLRKEKCLFIL